MIVVLVMWVLMDMMKVVNCDGILEKTREGGSSKMEEGKRNGSLFRIRCLLLSWPLPATINIITGIQKELEDMCCTWRGWQWVAIVESKSECETEKANHLNCSGFGLIQYGPHNLNIFITTRHDFTKPNRIPRKFSCATNTTV
ncbi:uncharacterized protein G2W53_004188 [Senna tora]|uniref:Uncharacterized protein n=1 Tax=Senna tora TaxID=362788 RepID=A0A835CJ44_9FABA|nr:uncharacterized protein G2W53_004188 [Senna tora]